MRRRAIPVAALAALAGSIAIATPAAAADTDIVINEVQSNSASDAPDFVELTNTGAEPVDISGWVVRDDDDTHTATIPADTTLAPGAFLVIETEAAGGFGLGSDDQARLFSADGTTLIDSYAWTDHAFSEGRVPDGVGSFGDTVPTPGAANVVREAPAEYDADATVAVNEVMSDDPDGGEDWIELTNTGGAAVDLSGWILRDDDDLSALPIAAGTVLEPGALLVIETNVTDDGFGLGSNDEIRLYLADGLGLVDSYAWTDHSVSEGRVPDGVGSFADTEPTPGAVNVARAASSAVVINEVETNGDARGDWVELANSDQAQTADVGGWTLVDGDPTHEPIVLPEGTTIESGGYLGIVTDAAFGLGGADSVTLRDAEAAVVATLSWDAHPETTLGRCPDMTGDFTDTGAGTFELPNDCEGGEEPPVDAEPWPFADEVTDAAAAGTWGEDMSGLDVAADGTVYAVNNDNAEIFRLEGGPETYTVAQSWVPSYPDGVGTPDAEGLTVAGDGAIFLSTERDNDDSGVSRPSVLRVELGADGTTTTTHEWNLTEVTGALGANAGVEAIEWISDEDATALGVRGPDGAYDPAGYGEHFGGVFVAAVEQTGGLHVLVLEADGTITELQSTTASAAVPVVMGLDWRAGGNQLWALCDEACDNRSSTFAFVDGTLAWQTDHAAPVGMNPSFTNEGIAMLWCEADAAAVPTVLWISDTAHDGVSLRTALGDECEQPTTPTEPTEPSEPTQPSEPSEPGAPTPIADDQLTDATRGGVTVPRTAQPGQTITVTIPGAAGQTVHVWLHSDPVLLVTAQVAADGTVQATIPTEVQPGQHRIVVQAADGTLIGWADITITASGEVIGSGIDGGLAETGLAVQPWPLVAALALLLLGGALVVRVSPSPRPAGR